jgi:hypothetical protein
MKCGTLGLDHLGLVTGDYDDRLLLYIMFNPNAH